MKRLAISALAIALAANVVAPLRMADAAATGVRVQLMDAATGKAVFVGPLTYANVKGDSTTASVTFTSASATATFTCKILMKDHAAAIELYKLADTTPNLNIGCLGTPVAVKGTSGTTTTTTTTIETDKYSVGY
jgi:hypothetical protein